MAPMAVAAGGQIEMLYDRRQRPPSVCLNDRVHLVFNAGGEVGAAPEAKTKPMTVIYDPRTRKFFLFSFFASYRSSSVTTANTIRSYCFLSLPASNNTPYFPESNRTISL